MVWRKCTELKENFRYNHTNNNKRDKWKADVNLIITGCCGSIVAHIITTLIDANVQHVAGVGGSAA